MLIIPKEMFYININQKNIDIIIARTAFMRLGENRAFLP